jgi:Protein of unknown function (DUF2721)
MNPQSALGLPTVLGVISAMITPAIFILATGSLVASTLSRIARVFDRARDLVDRTVTARANGDELAARTYVRWLRVYRRRTSLAERALTLYYCAIFLFVMTSLSIAAEEVSHVEVPWVSLGLVLLGAAAIAVATACLVIETNLAAGMLRAEIGQALGDDWHAIVPTENGGPAEDARTSTLAS